MREICSYCGGRELPDLPNKPLITTLFYMTITGPKGDVFEHRAMCESCVQKSGVSLADFLKCGQDPVCILGLFDTALKECRLCQHWDGNRCKLHRKPETCTEYRFREPCPVCKGSMGSVQNVNGRKMFVPCTCMADGGRKPIDA